MVTKWLSEEEAIAMCMAMGATREQAIRFCEQFRREMPEHVRTFNSYEEYLEAKYGNPDTQSQKRNRHH